jgi:hypothetical protein
MTKRRLLGGLTVGVVLLAALGLCALRVRRQWQARHDAELVAVSDEEIAFAKVKEGMSETEVRSIAGEPNEVQEPPRLTHVEPIDAACVEGARKLLLYQRAPRKSLLVLFDANRRVKCVERLFLIYGPWRT